MNVASRLYFHYSFHMKFIDLLHCFFLYFYILVYHFFSPITLFLISYFHSICLLIFIGNFS